MSEQEKEPKICKIVLLGENGVGKTSIIYRYINNTFKVDTPCTTGAPYVEKTVFMSDENQSIKFEIWDTPGNEKYRNLSKIFIKNADAIILVYNITYRPSFAELKNFWIKFVKENTPSNTSK